MGLHQPLFVLMVPKNGSTALRNYFGHHNIVYVESVPLDRTLEEYSVVVPWRDPTTRAISQYLHIIKHRAHHMSERAFVTRYRAQQYKSGFTAFVQALCDWTVSDPHICSQHHWLLHRGVPHRRVDTWLDVDRLSADFGALATKLGLPAHVAVQNEADDAHVKTNLAKFVQSHYTLRWRIQAFYALDYRLYNVYLGRRWNIVPEQLDTCFVKASFVFIHVPKNAYQSLKGGLIRVPGTVPVPFATASMRTLQYVDEIKRHNLAPKLVHVMALRHPLHRVVSAYLQVMQRGETHTQQTKAWAYRDDLDKSFRSFVEEIDQCMFDRHVVPQIAFLLAKGLTPDDVDEWFIVEKLPEQYQRFCDKYNVPNALQHKNRGDAVKRQQLTTLLREDTQLADKVRALYADDFLLYRDVCAKLGLNAAAQW